MSGDTVLGIFVVCWLATPLVAAFIGQKRVGGVVLAVLLGAVLPIIGALIVYVLPKRRPPAPPLRSDAVKDVNTPSLREIIDAHPDWFVTNFVTGEVMHVVNRDETYIYGGGGGGTIYTNSSGNVSGSIAPTWIKTKIVKRDEVWLKLPSGKETSYFFPREQFQCRAGHVITLAYLDKELVAAENHVSELQTIFFGIDDWRAQHEQLCCPKFWTPQRLLIGIGFYPVGLYWLYQQQGVTRRNKAEAARLWAVLQPLLEARYAAIAEEFASRRGHVGRVHAR